MGTCTSSTQHSRTPKADALKERKELTKRLYLYFGEFDFDNLSNGRIEVDRVVDWTMENGAEALEGRMLQKYGHSFIGFNPKEVDRSPEANPAQRERDSVRFYKRKTPATMGDGNGAKLEKKSSFESMRDAVRSMNWVKLPKVPASASRDSLRPTRTLPELDSKSDLSDFFAESPEKPQKSRLPSSTRPALDMQPFNLYKDQRDSLRSVDHQIPQPERKTSKPVWTKRRRSSHKSQASNPDQSTASSLTKKSSRKKMEREPSAQSVASSRASSTNLNQAPSSSSLGPKRKSSRSLSKKKSSTKEQRSSASSSSSSSSRTQQKRLPRTQSTRRSVLRPVSVSRDDKAKQLRDEEAQPQDMVIPPPPSTKHPDDDKVPSLDEFLGNRAIHSKNMITSPEDWQAQQDSDGKVLIETNSVESTAFSVDSEYSQQSLERLSKQTSDETWRNGASPEEVPTDG